MNFDSSKKYKICSRCIMDETVPEIRFDSAGICQFCKIHDKLEKIYPLGEQAKQKLNTLVKKIKNTSKNKKYNCVVGVSGGTDSTYTLYQAVTLGLRPLAVHFDNGWNSEIAVDNIYNVTKKLNVDLETIVADWEEFRDLQISFLRASVSDAEIPTDVAIHAVLHDISAKENIKFILLGHSFRTEGIAPKSWTYMDGRYINSVYKLFGKGKITSFPNINLLSILYYQLIKRIKVVPLLNYFNYNKARAVKILEKEFGWNYYGGHHHESLYTKFFQSYILPKKFNIDKRKLGLSARVRSGDIHREDALQKIKSTVYPIEPELVDYAISKLGLTKKEFRKIMQQKSKTYLDYDTYYQLLQIFKIPIRIGYRLKLVPDIIYFKYFD